MILLEKSTKDKPCKEVFYLCHIIVVYYKYGTSNEILPPNQQKCGEGVFICDPL